MAGRSKAGPLAVSPVPPGELRWWAEGGASREAACAFLGELSEDELEEHIRAGALKASKLGPHPQSRVIVSRVSLREFAAANAIN